MQDHCATTNLKSLCLSQGHPKVIQDMIPLIRKSYMDDPARASLLLDILAVDDSTSIDVKSTAEMRSYTGTPASNKGTIGPLDTEMSAAVCTLLGVSCKSRHILNESLQMRARFVSKYYIRGIKYTDFATSQSDSQIFFRSEEFSFPLFAGVITKILVPVHPLFPTMHLGDIIFVVHKYLPAPRTVANPFAAYPDFRANLYLNEPCDKFELLKEQQIKCHAIRRPWTKDATVMVMRPLDRARIFFAYQLFRVLIVIMLPGILNACIMSPRPCMDR